jgi:acyl phosphate:glycerol-3-phosphate acyltransferase
MTVSIFLLLAAAYVIGSIPWAVWISKTYYGVDVRTQGSMNAGATNTFRVLGKNAGALVLLLDVAKGMGAVVLSLLIKDQFTDHDYYIIFQVSLALVATLGHVFPVFANFKGGKGVATLTGAVFWIFPEAALVALVVFACVFFVSHYISLGSICASVAIVIAAIAFKRYDYAPLIGLLSLIPVLVVYTHRANIQRLLDGSENKMYMKRSR